MNINMKLATMNMFGLFTDIEMTVRRRDKKLLTDGTLNKLLTLPVKVYLHPPRVLVELCVVAAIVEGFHDG